MKEFKTFKLIILAASGFFVANVLGILKLILELHEENIITFIILIVMYTPTIIALFLYNKKIKSTRTKLSKLILVIAVILIIINLILCISYINTYWLK
jgi:hypothetical protein